MHNRKTPDYAIKARVASEGAQAPSFEAVSTIAKTLFHNPLPILHDSLGKLFAISDS